LNREKPIPIIPAITKVNVNKIRILDIFILAALSVNNVMKLQVTKEKTIGIIEMEINIKKSSLNGINIFPISGNKNPTIIAKKVAISVVYPLFNILIIRQFVIYNPLICRLND
jgi:hypothetical protein